MKILELNNDDSGSESSEEQTAETPQKIHLMTELKKMKLQTSLKNEEDGPAL